jgi:hypothetical protein
MDGKKECVDSTDANSVKRPIRRLWIGNMLNKRQGFGGSKEDEEEQERGSGSLKR